jgi:hypothetical protein
MLGPAKSRRLHEPITVSLEDFVPPDNFNRHLGAKLDLGFVRDWTRELYAERGRPSIDPVVFFKLQLVRNANIQGLLIAAGQNLKRLLAASGWGRRHAPCGSLVALPMELQRLSIVSG